ncbi:hypothetical protein BBO01nite_21850 [Brevibacillus borstelensis]|nr:hypothetical protein BBO01nite_21850 [Brevibacillus borstelensis]
MGRETGRRDSSGGVCLRHPELGIVTLDLSEVKRIKEQYPFIYMESRRADIYKANHLV